MTSKDRPPLRRLRRFGVLAVVALVAAACGGDDNNDTAAPGGNGDSGNGATEERAANPDNCPLDALDDADGTVDITLWHGISGLAALTLDEFAEEYNATQDRVRVRVESQGDYEELFTKFTEAARANDFNTMPDILLAEDTNTQFMVDSRAVVAAADCIAADPDAEAHYETLADFVRATYSVDGLLWPAAFGVSTPIIYYNRAHLEQAGLDPDDAPGDLESLRATAEAIKAVRPEGFPIIYRADSWWIENLSTREKDALVDNDNGRSGLGRTSELLNDTTLEVVDWMVQMVEDDLMKVIAYSQAVDGYLAVARAEADNSSMLIETSTAATTVDALLGGEVDAEDIGLGDFGGLEPIEIGVGELPGPRSAGSGQAGGNAWYMVDGQDPVKIAATWDFLRWITETPQQVKWTRQGSYLPVWQGAVDDADLQEYFTESRAGRWLQIARNSLESIDTDFPGPLIGPYKEFREANRTALENILIDGRSAEEELDRANTTFQAALDSYARDVGAD